jgi:hypothetical protein
METQNKTYPDLVVIRSDQAKESHPEPGLARRVLAYNDKLFLAEHQMVKGWAGAMHSHPHDQVVYIVRGHLRVNCLGKTFGIARRGHFHCSRRRATRGVRDRRVARNRCFHAMPGDYSS